MEYYLVSAAAGRIGVTTETLRRWIGQDKVPGAKQNLSGYWVIPVEWVEAQGQIRKDKP